MTTCRKCKARVYFGRCPACHFFNDPCALAPRTNTPPTPSIARAIIAAAKDRVST